VKTVLRRLQQFEQWHSESFAANDASSALERILENSTEWPTDCAATFGNMGQMFKDTALSPQPHHENRTHVYASSSARRRRGGISDHSFIFGGLQGQLPSSRLSVQRPGSDSDRTDQRKAQVKDAINSAAPRQAKITKPAIKRSGFWLSTARVSRSDARRSHS
jgi:hypothetical protein